VFEICLHLAESLLWQIYVSDFDVALNK